MSFENAVGDFKPIADCPIEDIFKLTERRVGQSNSVFAKELWELQLAQNKRSNAKQSITQKLMGIRKSLDEQGSGKNLKPQAKPEISKKASNLGFLNKNNKQGSSRRLFKKAATNSLMLGIRRFNEIMKD